MVCTGVNPLYWDPAQNQLVPLDSGTLKTTTWNYTQFNCDTGAGIGALFTPGEIVISLLVFWIFAVLVISIFLGRIFGIKIRQ
jgi:hypothetical protein